MGLMQKQLQLPPPPITKLKLVKRLIMKTTTIVQPIKDINNIETIIHKTTPKKTAQNILMDAVWTKLEFFTEDNQWNFTKASESEVDETVRQAELLANRIAKLLQQEGY